MFDLSISGFHSYPGILQKEDQSSSLQYYQVVDDYGIWGRPRDCAYGGCPGVAVMIDDPDTFFDLHWQMYLVAINQGMRLNNISGLMGSETALMNKTGVGNNRKNYILHEDLNAPDNPRLDKLRSFCLNTHAGHDDGINVYLDHFDGNNLPPMAIDPLTGKEFSRPRTVEEIIPEHYLILPSMPKYRHLFLDCNTVKWKVDTSTLEYGWFTYGIQRDWIGDNLPHSFFPFVSEKKDVIVSLKKFKKLPLGSAFPSPFRH